jgi:hypothetical protein
MQIKFNRRESLKESLLRKLVKVLILTLVAIFFIFLVSKIDFPSPNKIIQKDITNEIQKLK